MKDKAVRFLRDAVQDAERAGEFEDMSVEEYAAHKKLQLLNPRRKEIHTMPRQSRQDLIEENERLLDALEEAQESLADAQDTIGTILEGYEPEGEGEAQD